MKNKTSYYLLFIAFCILTSCGVVKKIRYNSKNSNSHGFQRLCQGISNLNSSTYNYYESEAKALKLKNGDTIVSVGAGSGWREFMYSVFYDSITFYLEDLDTSCITRSKIRNTYLPKYSKIKGSTITASFIPATGNETEININSNKANMILIIGAYHHFTNDMAIVRECFRILKPNGRLVIHEAVMNRNKMSFRFCDWGGFYKSEKNFIKDIVGAGFKLDTIYKYDKNFRRFFFTKVPQLSYQYINPVLNKPAADKPVQLVRKRVPVTEHENESQT